MSQSIPNPPKVYRNNYAGDNARVQYGDRHHGDVVHSNASPDQVPGGSLARLKSRTDYSVNDPMQQVPFDDIQQREHECQTRILLKHRTDEACHWITKVPAFQKWLSGQGPESLALLGKLGFGKTFMIAYVVQHLKSGDDTLACNTPTTTGTPSTTAASASQPYRNVYFYYCKDDGTTNKALNVFRSLISQFLKDHKLLCWQFNTWVREQEKDGSDPTFDPSCLGKLLIDLVSRTGTVCHHVTCGTFRAVALFKRARALRLSCSLFLLSRFVLYPF